MKAEQEMRTNMREPMMGSQVADGQAADPEGASSSASASASCSASIPPTQNTPALQPVGLLQLFRFVGPSDRAFLCFAVLGAVVQGTCGPLMSFFMKDLFQGIYLPNDDGSEPPEHGPHTNRDRHVQAICFVYLGLAVVAFSCSSAAYLGFARIADNMTLDLRRRFLDKLLKKDVGWYDKNSASSMATRLTSDTYDFRQGVGEKLVNVFVGCTMSPCGFLVAFIQDWRLSLMMLAVIPLMALAFSLAMKQMTASAMNAQVFYANAGAVAETSISSIRTVAAFGGYEKEIEKFNVQLQSAESNGTRAGWWGGLSMGFLQVVIWGTFAVGFYVGSFLVINDYNNDCWASAPPFGNCFTGAKMLSTLFAVLYGGIGFGQMAPGLAALAGAKAAAARIYEVIDQEPAFDMNAGTVLDKVTGLLEFRDVVFYYPSRVEVLALKRATWTVQAGTTAAFVGPSGSGKSTTIALMQRFYDPQGGSICMDGIDIRNLNLAWLRSKMSLVQQEPVLFTGTIQENICFGRDGASYQDAETAAKGANAHNFIQSFPNKYQTQVGERGVMLSGGQKQRIAIARAIVRNPTVLLLDEATSALDEQNERIVQEALNQLMARKAHTTLVVAHRLSTIKDADQIIVMENGTLLERGTHAELLKKDGSLYAQLLELQRVTGNDNATQLLRHLSSQSCPDSAGAEEANQSESMANVAQATRRVSRNVSRQFSGSVLGDVVEGSMIMQVGDTEMAGNTRDEMPPEDNENLPVPTTRLWEMQRSDLPLIVVALVATIPVAASRPLMGWLFAGVGDTFSTPLSAYDPETQTWHGVMDTDYMRQKTNVTCIGFALLASISGLLTWLQLGSFRKASEKLTKQIRLQTFTAMLRQEVGWFDMRTSGHLADRLATEAPLIKSFTGEQLASYLQLLFTVGTGIFMALIASWQLTLINALFVPLLMAGQRAVMKSRMRVNESTAGPLVSEVMGNLKTVAAFNLGDKMMKRYMDKLESESGQEAAASRKSGWGAAYNSCVSYLMFGGIVFIANIFIGNGWIQPGCVMQVLFPIMFCASGAAMASQWQADKAKAQTAVNHIFHTLDRKPEIDAYDEGGERLDYISGEIEFQHVSFRYPSRRTVPVFTDFDLKIKAGMTVAFCGPSGSGKSTTIALLQRFYDPDSGTVCLDGHDISTLNLRWLRKQMALVQQEPVLFEGTIRDNIAYGKDGATQQECEEAAKAANAHNFIIEKPERYSREVGERGSKLSGGEKQRIAIARSLVRDPRVLLLDEATSALDTEGERIVQEALDELLRASRRTTLIIAHRLSTIVNSDMICVIYEGKIVEKGTHSALMDIPNGHYKKLAQREDSPQKS